MPEFEHFAIHDADVLSQASVNCPCLQVCFVLLWLFSSGMGDLFILRGACEVKDMGRK
jgi:hypothetical protein